MKYLVAGAVVFFICWMVAKGWISEAMDKFTESFDEAMGDD